MGKDRKHEKWEGAKSKGVALWVQNNLHSLQHFLFKKNKKGMMEKGRESDKFNDVCSKLRLEK